ncbi:MAG: preprotein translocase subunit YajC [Chitinispirillales bacterium]|jgi:preprotein translocase subunit YajC|nr:preprotein translocase subunit YajC [Chitinispirillales bacterium]
MFLSKVLPSISAAVLIALPVFAQEQGGEPAPSPGLFGGNFMFIMIAMFVIIYFLMIRPEQRKQKERQKMLAALKKGDKILTIGGIVGVITNVKDSTYMMKTGEGTLLEVTKSAVSSVLTNDTAQGDKALGNDKK